jgi:hypothetical protein
MNKTAILTVFPLVLCGSAAFAEATDEGAAHLTEVFQTYLGTTEGVVAVAVDGDDYSLTLDAAPLIALAGDADGTASLTPLVMTLTDNGDGTWNVSQDQSLSIAFSMQGAADVKEDIGSMTMEGVFDEALMSFTTASGTMSDIKVSETITQPGQEPMSVEMTMASGTYEMTGTAGAMGGVDNTISVTMSGLSETFTLPGQDGAPGMPITLTAESLTESGKIDGLRPDAFYKTMAWFVAHPSEAAMDADKLALKSILQDGLPLFGMMAVTGAIKSVAVTTPMGNVGIEELSFAVDLNGLVADGKFREAISVSGLTLPEGVIPAWAVPILPQKASVDFQVTDFDAAAAAKVALGLFDLPAGTEPDAAFQGNLLKALMPNNTVTIGLNPGGVSGDGYALTYEGSMVAGPEMPIPTGRATITLMGIEKLQAALDAAPDDIKGQAMMGVGMAQGMAKPGPNGELVWEIDASTPGSLSVNGTPMMGGN